MSSDEDKRSDKGVLEYYKKYAQNQNLPKYFSGSSVSYLPPIISDEEVQAGPSKTSTEPLSPNKPRIISEVIKITTHQSATVIENCESSSSSENSTESLSGHKKLEWDNGADIGYSSARQNADKLQKSFSLPILDIASANAICDEQGPVLVPSTVITHSNSEENVGIVVFSSSTSNHTSPRLEQQKNMTSSNSSSKEIPVDDKSNFSSQQSTERSSKSSLRKSSSSSTTDNGSQFRDFQKTINFLKQKIGLPGAHSTPNSDNQSWGHYKVVGKRAVRKPQKVKIHGLQKQPSSDQGSKVEESIEKCESAKESKAPRTKNKDVQPSNVLPNSSKSSPKQLHKSVTTKVVELSISTPININCRAVSEPTVPSVQPKAVQTETVNLRHIETQIDIEPTPADKPESKLFGHISEDMADSASSFEYISVAKNSAFVNPIATGDPTTKRLKHKTSISGVLKEISLIKSTTTDSSRTSEDVDKHLEVLQRLFKSKKFNSSTKRRYIRKLLKELKDLDSTNNESTSSDLFIPKKDSPSDVLKAKLKSAEVFKRCSESVPQDTVVGNISKPCICRYTSSSSSKDCSSEPERIGKNVTDKGPSEFKGKDSLKFAQEINELQNRFAASLPISQAGIATNPCTAQSGSASVAAPTLPTAPNATSKSDPPDHVGRQPEDCLIRFAENERAYQLTWINNEISHLSKLKTILELKERQASNPVQSSYSSTGNYKLTLRNGSTKESVKKYVIKTDVDLKDCPRINYCIDGKEYIVSDSRKSSSDKGPVVIADIQVSSDEKHTNIKVRTICSVCKQVVCICASLSSEDSAPEICLNCHKALCVCTSSSSIRSFVDHNDEGEGLRSLLDMDSISPQQFNSLQRIFKRCGCSTKNPSCSCNFVRKLLEKFQVQLNKMEAVSEAVQTDDFSTESKELNTDEAGNFQPEKQHFTLENQTSRPELRSTTVQQVVASNNGGQQTSEQGLVRQVQTENVKNNFEMQAQVDGSHAAVQVIKELPLQSAQTQSGPQTEVGQSQAAVSREQIPTQTAKVTVCQGVQTEEFFFNASTNLELPTHKGASEETPPVTDHQVTGANKLESRIIKSDQDATKKLSQSEEVRNDLKTVQTEDKSSRSVQTDFNKHSSLTTTTSSDSKSNGASRVTCFCCKQKAFLAEVSYLQDGDESQVVCSRCYYNRPRYCNHNFHINNCRCWSYWCAMKRDTDGRQFCQCCRMEVRKCMKRPSSLMYTVTLQKKETKARLQNGIGDIKVQDGWSGKSLKDKENYDRKDSRKNYLKSEKAKRKSRGESQGRGRIDQNDKEPNNNNNENDVRYTLTEYLIKNKPQFIYSAEHRRQMLLNSRIMREQQKDNIKLNFLESSEKNSNEAKFKLFTGREMKEITKRNYKKLPEVQEKMVKQRQNRLRHADKLISNMFARTEASDRNYI